MEMRIFILSLHIMETFRKLSSMSFSIWIHFRSKKSKRFHIYDETRKVKGSEREEKEKLKRKFLSNEIDYKVTIKARESLEHKKKVRHFSFKLLFPIHHWPPSFHFFPFEKHFQREWDEKFFFNILKREKKGDELYFNVH